MRVHLGGWQRLGIVASVLWAISAGVVAREADLRRAEGAMNFAYRVCSENADAEHDYDFSKCQKESEKTNEAFLQHSWASAALVVLAPLPLFWLLAYQLVGIWRWVRRGFIPAPHSSNARRSKDGWR